MQQISALIEEIANKREQSHVVATTAILAGLVLNKQFIQRVLRREIMRESVIYQDIRAEEAANVVFRLLKRKIVEFGKFTIFDKNYLKKYFIFYPCLEKLLKFQIYQESFLTNY